MSVPTKAERHAEALTPRAGDYLGRGEAVLQEIRATDPDDGPDDGPQLVNLAEVTSEPVRWTWRGYLPAGKLTLFDGDPGDGKSTLMLDLAARVSTGSPMPDGSSTSRGRVLVLTAEDGIKDTVRPRLVAAGGDPARVLVLDEIVEDGTGRPVELPRDLTHVDAIVRKHEISLVIVDPLMAFLAGVDSHNDQSVRRALHPLSKLAESTGAAVAVVRHLNKASGGRALYRGGGSIGIAGAARAVHLVAPDPEDETRRLLAPVKVNIAAKPPTLAYRLVPDELHGCARIVWEGSSGHTADQLVNVPDEQERNSHADALAFLTEALGKGARLSREIEDEARNAHGIAGRTLDNARRTLGVKAHKITGHWWMELPRTQGRNTQEGASLRPCDCPRPDTGHFADCAVSAATSGESG